MESPGDCKVLPDADKLSQLAAIRILSVSFILAHSQPLKYSTGLTSNGIRGSGGLSHMAQCHKQYDKVTVYFSISKPGTYH